MDTNKSAGTKIETSPCFLIRVHSWLKKSTNFNFHPPDFILNVAVSRLLAEFFQIRVFGEPVKIVITEVQRFFERERGTVELVGERIAASEVVKNERTLWFEAREAFVH